MKARKAQKLRDGLVISGFFVMLTAYLWEPLLTIGAIVMITGLIPDFLYNKCPHCRKRLGRNEGAFCHHCGGKIDG